MPLPFTWSWSRYQTWRRCPRRFWLNVYEAPRGRAAGVGQPAFDIWIQRNLMGRAQWAGLSAHRAVEWYLKATVEGRKVDRDGVVDRALREAKRTIELSSTGFYRGEPRKFRGFDAHYYDVPLDGVAALQELEDKVTRLLAHPVLDRLCQVPERVREVEKLTRIRLWGVDIWLSPDVVVEDGAGGYVIVDWKTGSRHETADVDGQLGLYALHVLQNWVGVRPDGGGALPLHRVRGLVASLGDPPFRNRTLTEADVDAARDALHSSVPQMRGDAVSALDEPPPESAFPKLREGDSTCGWCSFRRTCGRELP